jgi:hypothetical protein
MAAAVGSPPGSPNYEVSGEDLPVSSTLTTP